MRKTFIDPRRTLGSRVEKLLPEHFDRRTRTSLGEVKNLPRIQEPLEFLHQLGALVPPRLRVEKHEDGRRPGARDGLKAKRHLPVLGLDLVVVLAGCCGRGCCGLRSLLVLLLVWRVFQTRFEAVFARNFDDPRRWYNQLLTEKQARTTVLLNQKITVFTFD